MNHEPALHGVVIDENIRLTLGQLCRACAVHAELVVDMVEEGVLEPVDRGATPWQFSGLSLRRAQTALRLQQDLAINLAGAALALQLLDEIDVLRSRLGSGRV